MAAYEVLLLNTAIPQIQAAQSGDTYVCPRDIAFSAALTLSAGTANGVPYLNGSKVLTTGSALTFDGTTFKVQNNNTASPVFQIQSYAAVGTAIANITYDQATDIYKFSNPSTYAGSGIDFGTGASFTTRYHIDTGGTHIWTVSSEAMRLTSTGLGIGTNNPGGKLDVKQTTDTSLGGIYVRATDNNAAVISRLTTGNLVVRNGGIDSIFLDSSGNLGLGVTPSAWDFGGNLVLPGSGTYIAAKNINITFGANLAYTGGAEKYVASNPASKYYQGSGTHVWFNAPSGTADGTAATALTSAQNGNSYTIKEAGTTDFTLIGAADNNVGTTFTKSGGTGAGTGTVSQNISFTQAMTLDASGTLLVGTTAASGNKLIVNGVTRSMQAGDRTALAFAIDNTSGAPSWQQQNLIGHYWTGSQDAVSIRVPASTDSTTGSYDIFADGSHIWYAAGGSNATGSTATERARITSGGDFQTSSGNSVMVGGTAARATTAGTNRVDIFDGTAPVGTLANGVSFYSASGEANVMDAAGNATLLSPHDAETNEWIFRSKHTPTGKVLKIDVERLLKFVNDHFGLDAVHEFVEK